MAGGWPEDRLLVPWPCAAGAAAGPAAPPLQQAVTWADPPPLPYLTQLRQGTRYPWGPYTVRPGRSVCTRVLVHTCTPNAREQLHQAAAHRSRGLTARPHTSQPKPSTRQNTGPASQPAVPRGPVPGPVRSPGSSPGPGPVSCPVSGPAARRRRHAETPGQRPGQGRSRAADYSPGRPPAGRTGPVPPGPGPLRSARQPLYADLTGRQAREAPGGHG